MAQACLEDHAQSVIRKEEKARASGGKPSELVLKFENKFGGWLKIAHFEQNPRCKAV